MYQKFLYIVLIVQSACVISTQHGLNIQEQAKALRNFEQSLHSSDPERILLAASLARDKQLGEDKIKQAASAAYKVFVNQEKWLRAMLVARHFGLEIELMEQASEAFISYCILECSDPVQRIVDTFNQNNFPIDQVKLATSVFEAHLAQRRLKIALKILKQHTLDQDRVKRAVKIVFKKAMKQGYLNFALKLTQKFKLPKMLVLESALVEYKEAMQIDNLPALLYSLKIAYLFDLDQALIQIAGQRAFELAILKKDWGKALVVAEKCNLGQEKIKMAAQRKYKFFMKKGKYKLAMGLAQRYDLGAIFVHKALCKIENCL